jgi:hypothetical protein
MAVAAVVGLPAAGGVVQQQGDGECAGAEGAHRQEQRQQTRRDFHGPFNVPHRRMVPRLTRDRGAGAPLSHCSRGTN